MFDKIALRARIDVADIDTIVLRNYLEQCTEGDEVFYRSTAYANFDGVFIEIRGGTLRCKCSINKLFARERTGKMDNSRPMTWRHAVRTIRELLLRLSVKEENAVVTYYEVGVTMKMKCPPEEYIRNVLEVGGRVLWVDANYRAFKQKTTEKSKYYRKVMKIYDKTFEQGEKGRFVGDNVLRLETVYKHQSIQMTELLENATLAKIGRVFYNDWNGIKFRRELEPTKGVKMSQVNMAREIHLLGVTRYKERYKQMYVERKVTKKQWETMRVYADHWEEEKMRYREVVGVLEEEYKEKLLNCFQAGSITPILKKK